MSLALTALVISWLVALGIALGRIPSPLAYSSERSLHLSPTPRGGGLGIAIAFIGVSLFSGGQTAFIVSVVFVWAVSAADDWWGVAAKARICIHVLGALVLIAFWLPELGWVGALIALFVIVWGTNLFNFMDGADGTAATMAALGAGTLAYIAAHSTAGSALTSEIFVLAACLCGAAIGFLFLNLPPARIFMGDGGSTVLGFVLASISIAGAVEGIWHPAVPIALFAPFWADASWTLARRMYEGHSPTTAHRDHYYQRLVLAGLGHRGLLVWITTWGAISVVVAMILNANIEIPGAIRTLVALGFGAVYLFVTHIATKRPPVNLMLNPRAPTALLYDLSAVALAWAALFWVRFNSNFDSANYAASDVIRSLGYVLPIHAIVFVSMGLYRGIWRFASLPDMWLIMRAAFVAAAITGLMFLLVRPDSFIWPRFVLAAQPFLLIILMGGARMAVRSWKEHRLYGLSAIRGEPVVILGAGAAAANFIKQLQRSDLWRPVALLDDDISKRGIKLHDIFVAGSLDDVGSVARRFGAQHAIVAMPSATHQERRRAVQLAAAAKLHTLTVPAYDELLTENDTHARLRAIELEDLLGRDPVELDTAGLNQWFAGKTVLITGAGGSIGRELCAQIARFHPARIVLLDISEFAAYDIYEHLQQIFDVNRIQVYVADVRNRERIQQILAAESPSIVFHAAAYKHVPMTETVNAWEAVRNNTYGTIVMAQCAREIGAEKFVLVSTDKAVRPSSIMGASKRLAELACMSFSHSPTQFVGVRFGNVLGSNGSVIPKFRKQIDAGGPVTVTHPDMTRFFMSIPEAAQLVLQAGLLGTPGSLYVLDMGEPVKIVDLAKELIRLAKGHEEAIPIAFTGLRLGEKMHEELIGATERFESTRHAKVRRVVTDSPATLDLDELLLWLNGNTPPNVHKALQRWVIDFKPPSI